MPADHCTDGFIDAKVLAPDLVVALRYAVCENMTGRPLAGYELPPLENLLIAGTEGDVMEGTERVSVAPAAAMPSPPQAVAMRALCTTHCAERLAAIHSIAMRQFGLVLVVYDAYRPRQAVDDLFAWASQCPAPAAGPCISPSPQAHPVVEGRDDQCAAKYFPSFGPGGRQALFEQGYISKRSNHARGSTVDVTLTLPTRAQHVAFASGDRRAHAGVFLPMTQRDPRYFYATGPAEEEDAVDGRIRAFLVPILQERAPTLARWIDKALEEGLITGCREAISSSSTTNAVVSSIGSLPFVDDGTLDMGTSFDLFDTASHPICPGLFTPLSSFEEHQVPRDFLHPRYVLRRLLLQWLFETHGFEISPEEWWHFWLRADEPFPLDEDHPEWGFHFPIF